MLNVIRISQHHINRAIRYFCHSLKAIAYQDFVVLHKDPSQVKGTATFFFG
jgi:hypothetical protein